MLDGKKTVVENEIKKEELNREAEENKHENLYDRSQIPEAANERYGIGIRQQSKSDNNLHY